jgi:hypothetical protein
MIVFDANLTRIAVRQLILQQAFDRLNCGVPSLFGILAKIIQFIERVLIDAFALQVLFEDCDVAAELVDAALLCGGNPLSDLFQIDRRLRWFARPTWFLRRIEVSQIINRHTEPLDIRAGKLEVDVFFADAGDAEDGSGAAYAHSLADGWESGIVMFRSSLIGFLGKGFSQLLFNTNGGLRRGIFSRLFRFLGRHDLFAASWSMKQAELLLGVLAGYINGNAAAQFKIAFDGFGSPYELSERIGYLALIELGPVSDFNVVEKYMKVDVFQVTLELALGKQERPEFEAVGHGVMVAAGRQNEATSSLWGIVRYSGSASKEPRPMLIAYSSAVRSSSVSLSLHML